MRLVDGGDGRSSRVHKTLQHLDQMQGTGSVQSHGRLVKEQDTRIPKRLDGNANPPTFSAGTPALLDPIADSGISTILETEFENDFLDQLFSTPLRNGG